MTSINPQHDATISEATPNDNFGSSSTLSALSGTNDSRFVMQFDLSSLEYSVFSATLILTVDSITPSFDLAIHKLDNSFDESTAIWSNIGSNDADKILIEINSSVSIVTIPMLEEWVIDAIDNNSGVLSLIFMVDDADSFGSSVVGAVFDSSEGSEQPVLHIVEEMPKMIFPSLFVDHFRYQGVEDMPGSISLPETWEASSGSFTTQSEHFMKCSDPGELVYIGTSLDNLRVKDDNNNYLIQCGVTYQDDLEFEIRGRRLDADNYSAIGIDFSNDSVYLTGKSDSGDLNKISVYHNLVADTNYIIDLWIIGNSLIASVNDAILLSTQWDNSSISHGFSLNVSAIPTEYAKFNFFQVFEIVEHEDPVPPNGDLLYEHRKRSKHVVENPEVKNWASFKSSYFRWLKGRNLGVNNEAWESKGYPIKEPSSEDWFRKE